MILTLKMSKYKNCCCFICAKKYFMNLSREISRASSKISMIRFALIDLSGTLHVEDEPTPGAVQALERLRESNIQFKFVTNTTKESSITLYNRLRNIGFNVSKSEIYSSLSAAVKLIEEGKFNPFYLVSEDARTDFPPTDNTRDLDAVVVGLAPKEFHYENLNQAFKYDLLIFSIYVS